MYETIANRDRDTAVQAIPQHLRASQQRIIQIFQQFEPVLPLKAEAASQIQCPHCQSIQISRNGRRANKQNYVCRNYGRQFLSSYDNKYSAEMRERCIALHRNGNGFREIERITGVNHNTVIRWVKADQPQDKER